MDQAGGVEDPCGPLVDRSILQVLSTNLAVAGYLGQAGTSPTVKTTETPCSGTQVET